jgi:amino-acid N-acetyltransferase
MRILAASHQELAEIEALLARLSLPTTGLLDQFPNGYAVAIDRGRVVGCAGLEAYGASGLLRSVAVDLPRQRLGIGGELVADRINAARTLKLDAVYLLTTTAPDYFARFGFEPADRARVAAPLAMSAEFAGVCPASATCLSLRL